MQIAEQIEAKNYETCLKLAVKLPEMGKSISLDFSGMLLSVRCINVLADGFGGCFGKILAINFTSCKLDSEHVYKLTYLIKAANESQLEFDLRNNYFDTQDIRNLESLRDDRTRIKL